jgi:hypothetical protein
MHARTRRWTFGILVALSLAPVLAHGDVPPEPDSNDAHCSLPEQCPGGTFCPYQAPAPPDSAQRARSQCLEGVAKKGLERRCRHGGNYQGEELYCPKGETGTFRPKRAGCGR